MNPVLLLSIFYIILACALIRLLKKIRLNSRNVTFNRFSIVIACRNESENLTDLFMSLEDLDYPKDCFEIIFIDDNSTDLSFEHLESFCLKSYQYHCYRNNSNQTGKKFALQKGINNSLYEWILFTDADCIVHKDWLKTFNNSIIHDNYKYSMYIGYSPEIFRSSFQNFKNLVSAIIFACSTMVGFPFSCTSRNLLFKKNIFQKLKGYNDILKYSKNKKLVSSGDDKILLTKFIKDKQKISYLPYPPVYTKPVDKKTRSHQNLRRYGKFSMSPVIWQVIMVFIALILLYIPYYIITDKDRLINLIIYFLSINFLMTLGFLIHKEKIRFVYYLYSLFFPYYLAYQMTISFFRKWSWKGR